MHLGSQYNVSKTYLRNQALKIFQKKSEATLVLHNLFSFLFQDWWRQYRLHYNTELEKWAIFGPIELDLKKKKLKEWGSFNLVSSQLKIARIPTGQFSNRILLLKM